MSGKPVYFTNGRIYSMEKEGDLYTGMLVQGDRIMALYRAGEEPGAPHTSPPGFPSGSCRVIDLDGKTVLPGFTDAHSHFLSSAVLNTVGCSISEVRDGKLSPDTVAGAVEKLRIFARGSKTAGCSRKKFPVIGFNYVVPSIREDRLPYRSELDSALPGRQVIVLSMDGHSSAYSSPALEALGIDPTDHPGILSGEDHDMHVGMVTGLVTGSLSVFDIVKAVQDFAFTSAAKGLTCLHCLDGAEDKPDDLSLRLLILAARALPLRLRLFTQYKETEAVRPFLKSLSYPRLGGCQAWEMDGSVGSRSAAFDEAYAGTKDNRGLCYYSREEILPFVKKAHREGFQVTAHAIGPRGIETILSAFEEVMKDDVPAGKVTTGKVSTSKVGGDKTTKALAEKNPLRHRIDHFEFPRPDQVRRAIGELGLLITAQPGYSWMDEHFQKAYRSYLSPAQFEQQIPLKTITEMGGIICGSSDSPVQDNDPFLQLQGMTDFPIHDQRLSIYQALRTYTFNGAYATFEEKTRGTLSVGKTADFIILEEDPFLVGNPAGTSVGEPARHIAGTRVVETWIAGKLVRRKILPAPLFLLKAFFSRRVKV